MHDSLLYLIAYVMRIAESSPRMLVVQANQEHPPMSPSIDDEAPLATHF